MVEHPKGPLDPGFQIRAERRKNVGDHVEIREHLPHLAGDELFPVVRHGRFEDTPVEEAAPRQIRHDVGVRARPDFELEAARVDVDDADDGIPVAVGKHDVGRRPVIFPTLVEADDPA